MIRLPIPVEIVHDVAKTKRDGTIVLEACTLPSRPMALTLGGVPLGDWAIVALEVAHERGLTQHYALLDRR